MSLYGRHLPAVLLLYCRHSHALLYATVFAAVQAAAATPACAANPRPPSTYQPTKPSHQQQQQPADTPIAKQPKRRSHQQQQQDQEQQLADIDAWLQDRSAPRKRSSHQEHTNVHSQPTQVTAASTAAGWAMDDLSFMDADAAACLLEPTYAEHDHAGRASKSRKEAAAAAAAADADNGLLDSSWMDVSSTAIAAKAAAVDDVSGAFPVSPYSPHLGCSRDRNHWQPHRQQQQQQLVGDLLDEHMFSGAAAEECTVHRRRGSSNADAAAIARQQQELLPDIDISLHDTTDPSPATAALADAAVVDNRRHSSNASADLCMHQDCGLAGGLEGFAKHSQQQWQGQPPWSVSPNPILAGTHAAVSADSPISFQGFDTSGLDRQQHWQQQQGRQLLYDEPLLSAGVPGCSALETLDDAGYGVLEEQKQQQQQDITWRRQQQQGEGWGAVEDGAWLRPAREQGARYSAASCGDALDLQLDEELILRAGHASHHRSSTSRCAMQDVAASSYGYAAELGGQPGIGMLADADAEKEQELEELLLGFANDTQCRRMTWQQQQQKEQQLGAAGRAGECSGYSVGHHTIEDWPLHDDAWDPGQKRQQDWQQQQQWQDLAAADDMGDGFTPLGLGITTAAAAAAGCGASPAPSMTEGRCFMTRLQQLLSSPLDGLIDAAQPAAAPIAAAAESVASGLGEGQPAQQQQHLTAQPQHKQQQQQRLQQQVRPADSCETVQQLDQGPEACSRQERTRPTGAAVHAAAGPAAAPLSTAGATVIKEQLQQRQQQQAHQKELGLQGSAPLLLPFHERLLRSASPQPKRRRRYATSNSLCSNQRLNANSCSSSSRVGRRLRWSGTAAADTAATAAAGDGATLAAAEQPNRQGKQNVGQEHQERQGGSEPLQDISNFAAVKAGGGGASGLDILAAGKQQHGQRQHTKQKKLQQHEQKASTSAQKRKHAGSTSAPQQKQLQQSKLPFLPVKSSTSADKPQNPAAAAAASAGSRGPETPAANKPADNTPAPIVKKEALSQEDAADTKQGAALLSASAAVGGSKLRSSLSRPRQLLQGDAAAAAAGPFKPRKRVRFADLSPGRVASGSEQQQQQQQQDGEQEQRQLEGEQQLQQSAETNAAAPAEDHRAGAPAPAAVPAAAGPAAARPAGTTAARAAAATAARQAASSTAPGASVAAAVGSTARVTAIAGDQRRAAASRFFAADQQGTAAAAAARTSTVAAGNAGASSLIGTCPAILSVDDLAKGGSRSRSLVPGSVSRQQLQQAHTLDQVR
jgi:hypothetical protein